MEKDAIELTYFLKGKLKVFQPKKGYRFSIDALLLGYFLKLKPKEKILEVCAGSGIISLIALYRFPKCKIFSLEIEDLLTKIIFLNAEENFKGKLLPIRGDILKPPFKENFWDVIFCNPPYFKIGSGRENIDTMENLARRKNPDFFTDFIKIIKRLLKNRGRLYLIFSAYRFSELIFLLKKEGLEPKRLRLVHSYPEGPAKFTLVEAIKQGGEETIILPPLYIYTKPSGEYTEELKSWLNGEEKVLHY